MNVVREINSINEKELDLAPGSGSWHDQYKDSAYIFIGGLNYELTEGDVVTVFSQYGEIADIDMPRDKATGKRRGFAFLMYEDQRSTVLAVDNLNGAELLGRTLRVDHVQNYKQKELVDGKWVDRETERLNARPELNYNEDRGEESDESAASSHPSIDPDDPMRDFLIEQRRAEKKKSSKRKHENETPEERRARKERKRAKKLAKEEKNRDREHRMITESSHGHRSRQKNDNDRGDRHPRAKSPRRRRSRSMSITPPPRGKDDRDRERRRSTSRSRSPRRAEDRYR